MRITSDAWHSMTSDQQIEAIDVTEPGWDFPGAVNAYVMQMVYEKEAEFQKTLKPNDPRHLEMFDFTDCKGWILIYWGGYEYPYELSRFKRPEDILWFIHHISQKEWKHMTPWRVSLFIENVCSAKNWPAYGVVPHPNEAPRPNHDVAAERAKMTPALRYAVIKRDGYRCRACGFSVQDGAHLHVDHIHPVSKGGRTERENLQTLCTVCNLGKKDL